MAVPVLVDQVFGQLSSERDFTAAYEELNEKFSKHPLLGHSWTEFADTLILPSENHPSMWLMTDEFSRLKIRESSEDFGRAVRAGLSPDLLTKWNHEDADLSDQPLGRECHQVSESSRVGLVAEPEALCKFITERMDEFMELVPAIDQALQKMTRR